MFFVILEKNVSSHQSSVKWIHLAHSPTSLKQRNFNPKNFLCSPKIIYFSNKKNFSHPQERIDCLPKEKNCLYLPEKMTVFLSEKISFSCPKKTIFQNQKNCYKKSKRSSF